MFYIQRLCQVCHTNLCVQSMLTKNSSSLQMLLVQFQVKNQMTACYGQQEIFLLAQYLKEEIFVKEVIIKKTARRHTRYPVYFGNYAIFRQG